MCSCCGRPLAYPPPAGWSNASAAFPTASLSARHLLYLAPKHPDPSSNLLLHTRIIHNHNQPTNHSICAYTDDDESDDCCAVLLAAAGDGAEVLERHVVMRGHEWSAACLQGGAGRLIVPDAAQVCVGAALVKVGGGCLHAYNSVRYGISNQP